MPASTECAAALLSFGYPSIRNRTDAEFDFIVGFPNGLQLHYYIYYIYLSQNFLAVSKVYDQRQTRIALHRQRK